MARYAFQGYGSDALRVDAASGRTLLDLSASCRGARLRFEFTDTAKDAGSRPLQIEAPEQAQNRIGRVFDGQDGLVGQGRFKIEPFGSVQASAGAAVTIHRIAIAGQTVGFVPSAPLAPGHVYDCLPRGTESDLSAAPVDIHAGRDAQAAASVVCFGPGVMVMTDRGEVPVEWLETSDKVLTRDHRFQPILRIGRARLPAQYFQQNPEDCPVRLPAGALGQGAPSHDLHLAGNHRLLLRSYRAKVMHGAAEVLAPVQAWADLGRAEVITPRGPFTFTHLLLGARALVLVEGVWVESHALDQRTLNRCDAGNLSHFRRMPRTPGRDRKVVDISAATPRHAGGPGARDPLRPCLTRSEAHVLIEQSRESAATRLPETVAKRG